MNWTLFSTLCLQSLQYIDRHFESFMTALALHLGMSIAAVSIATAIAFPFGFWVARQRHFPETLLHLFNGLRVVPGLAILALLMPVLGTGVFPAIFALVILAVPVIFLNTVSGVRQIDALAIEAAMSLGMTSRERFVRVELPLMLPSLMNGLRIASVEVIAAATLTAFIGAGGLGAFIVNGLNLYDISLLMVGAVPVALMAMSVDTGFHCITTKLTRYQQC